MAEIIIYKQGQEIGSCIYLNDVPSRINGQRRALFQCKCQKQFEAVIQAVKRGHTSSCGCQSSRKMLPIRNTKHGLRNTKEYDAWCSMKFRCENTNYKRHKDWGGKGISVCERWIDSFENFYLDMGPAPTQYHTLDRFPNQNGNYEPGNCRWATQLEQNRNRNITINITYKEETKTLKEWADDLGLPYEALRRRIRDKKMDIEKAFTTPIHVSVNNISYNGETKNLTEWSKDLNMDYVALSSRINSYGWSVEKAFQTPIKKYKCQK